MRDAGAALGGTYADLKAVIAADAMNELDGAGTALPMSDVTLLPPLTSPEKILCIGLNYLPHILETGRPKPEYPTIFTRYPDSVVAHGQAMIRPAASSKFDYEGELAVIIGKPGRHIAEADVWGHIAGYSCFNDGSIRDFQNHTTQFWPGKNFEGAGAFGPWIVTADAVDDITAQTLTTRVNGNVEQHTPISDMAITIPELIAYASTVTTLNPAMLSQRAHRAAWGPTGSRAFSLSPECRWRLKSPMSAPSPIPSWRRAPDVGLKPRVRRRTRPCPSVRKPPAMTGAGAHR